VNQSLSIETEPIKVVDRGIQEQKGVVVITKPKISVSCKSLLEKDDQGQSKSIIREKKSSTAKTSTAQRKLEENSKSPSPTRVDASTLFVIGGGQDN
jgi:hypothetical protein